MTATIINNLTGEEIKAHSGENHQGKQVWFDERKNAILPVGVERNAVYHVVLDEPWAERLRIGRRLAQLRKEQGLTIRDLASKTGYNQSNISNIENGRHSAGLDVLSKIAAALGTEITL